MNELLVTLHSTEGKLPHAQSFLSENPLVLQHLPFTGIPVKTKNFL